MKPGRFSITPDRLRLVPVSLVLKTGELSGGLVGYYFPKHGKYVSRFIYENYNLFKRGRIFNIPAWAVCKQLYTIWVVEGRIPSNKEVTDEFYNVMNQDQDHQELERAYVWDATADAFSDIIGHYGIENLDSYTEDPATLKKIRASLKVALD